MSASKRSTIWRVKNLWVIGACAALLFMQGQMSQAADYPPLPGPSDSPAPTPPAPEPSAPAPEPSAPAPEVPAPVAALPGEPVPVTVSAPLEVVISAPLEVVKLDPAEPPAAKAVEIAEGAPTQVLVDGKLVNADIGSLKNAEPGTVGVGISGDGFTFSVSAAASTGGDSANGTITIVNGVPTLNTVANSPLTTGATGFKPNDKVSLYVFSKEIFLGNVLTSAKGEFNAQITLPDLAPGSHHFQSSGLTPEGTIRTISLAIEIAPGDYNGESGGSSVTPFVYFALLMLILLVLISYWVILIKERKKSLAP